MLYPILSVVPELKDVLKTNPVVILQAPPGAGKSTVLPLHLLHEDWLVNKKILMLEPRRLAARSVALRMAAQREEKIGDVIGYKVRFENKTSHQTRVEVLTEGILTRMIQSDNGLEEVGLVIFDEFHERSLQSDLALVLTIQIQQVLRPDLRILLMSATMDSGYISERLKNAPVISSSGKQFPVVLQYANNESSEPIPVQVARAVRHAINSRSGDILVFLPGSGEIKRTQEILIDEHPGLLITPLYGDLSFTDQQKAILPDPNGLRKVVLATSIAETSLTIEGITIVIDSGFSRVPRFNPRSGLTRLETVRVTNDSADQRAGRAGRLGPGVCYRLWSTNTQQLLIQNRFPEIMEADLASLVLELAMWGITNMADLTWVTPPPAGAVNQAKDLLHQLKALDNDKITDRGRAMVRLPTHPRIAHMLIEATGDPFELELAIDCAALLEERDPLSRQYGADLSLRIDEVRKFRRGEPVVGDRFVLERTERLARSWRKLFNIPAKSGPVLHTRVGRLLLAAYPDRIAQQMEKYGDRYKLAGGRIARLLADDPMVQERWIISTNLDAREGDGKIFMAAPLEQSDLLPLSREEEIVKWDEQYHRIVGTVEDRIGLLIVERRPLPNIPWLSVLVRCAMLSVNMD
jgi:ATP-dependent RNA helicase HrpB